MSHFRTGIDGTGAPGACLALGLCLALAGCGGGGGDDGGTDAGATSAPNVANAPPIVREDAPPAFTGPNFTFAIGPSIPPERFDAGGASSLSAFFEANLAPLNALTGLLPKTVPVRYEQCGFPNAFYDVLAETITLCDELGEFVFERLSAPGAGGTDAALDDDVAATLTAQTLAFVLYHEIGHALDEQLDLPLVGNVESGADGIAAVISVETGNSLYGVLGAALFEDQPASFADSHGGGADRAGDLLCWTLGGDSRLMFDEAFAGLVAEFAQAGRDCIAEYDAQRRSVLAALPGLGGLEQGRANASVPAAAPAALGAFEAAARR